MSVSALTHKTTEQFLPSLKEETLVDTATATVTVKLDGLSEFRELVERFEKALAQGGTIAGWPAWSVSVGPRRFNEDAAEPQNVDTIQVRDRDGDVWSKATHGEDYRDWWAVARTYYPLVEVLPGEDGYEEPEVELEAEPAGAAKFKVGDQVRITGPLTSHNAGDVVEFEAGQIVTVAGEVGGEYDDDILIEGLSRNFEGRRTQWIDPDSLTLAAEPRVWQTFADVPKGVKAVDKSGDTLEWTESGDVRSGDNGSQAPVYWADYWAPFTEVIEWSPATEVQVVVGGHEFKAGDRVKVTGPLVLASGSTRVHLTPGETGTVAPGGFGGDDLVHGDVTGFEQFIASTSLSLVTEPRVFESVADIPVGVEVSDKGNDQLKRFEDGVYRTGWNGGGAESLGAEGAYQLNCYDAAEVNYAPKLFGPFTEVLN